MQYSTLIGEIAKAHINYVDIAAKLNISRDTLRNKLHGKTSFTIDEAFIIRNNYFPTATFEQLFSREQEKVS